MTEESNKNMEKYKAYYFAFYRIDQALKEEFPLEAIALEESIISDRLRAYCEANNLPTKDEQGDYSLHKLIKASRKANQSSKCVELHKFLDSVYSWKNERNKLIHKVVRTEKSGEAPEIPPEDFIPRAMEYAMAGKDLARTICNISNKLRRAAEKQAKESS